MSIKERLENGNLRQVGRIIEGVIIAAIVGGITIYGNSRVIETKLEGFFTDLQRIEKTVEKVVDRLNKHIEKER